MVIVLLKGFGNELVLFLLAACSPAITSSPLPMKNRDPGFSFYRV